MPIACLRSRQDVNKVGLFVITPGHHCYQVSRPGIMGSVEIGLVAPSGADVLFVEDIDDDVGGRQTVHVVFHAAQSASPLQRHLAMPWAVVLENVGILVKSRYYFCSFVLTLLP